MKTESAVKALAALAQETRLSIFRFLVAEGDPVAAGDIAQRLNVPPATLSFHLKELLAAGLVSNARDGRSILYEVNRKGMAGLMEFLSQDCCKGRPELCGVRLKQKA